MKLSQKTRSRVLNIHKILGLITGVVIFIVSVTGCLWVFKNEIESFSDSYKIVEENNIDQLTPSEVKLIAEKVIPNKAIHGVVYGQKNEALEVIFYESAPVFYSSVFINPYSGKVVKCEDHLSGFFGFVLNGHVSLWLPKAIGSRVVSYSVLLFLFLIISGILLWWPKNKHVVKQRLVFKWSSASNWKRKNFDLHTILGFYVSSLALTLTFTGCVMAFNWFYFIAYKAAGGSKAPQFIIPENISSSDDDSTYQSNAIDFLVPKLRKEYPKANSFEIHYPSEDSTCVYVEVNNSVGVHYNADYLFFDQYTLESIPTSSIYGEYKNAHFADKLIRMNYDIHVGSIGGLFGKIIAFISSLLIASLPISGILMWYGRRFKKKRNPKKR